MRLSPTTVLPPLLSVIVTALATGALLAMAMPGDVTAVPVVVPVAATGVTSILEASLVGALALLVFGVLSPTEMRGVVDLNVLVVIASSFGLGAAILETGLADRVAEAVRERGGELTAV